MNILYKTSQILARAAWSLANRVEMRSSRVSSALATQLSGGPVWAPRNYDTFAAEGYQKNVVAYRAIEMVAGGVSSIPWTLFRTKKGEVVEEVKDHPFLSLIQRPNPLQDRKEFIHEVVGFYLVAGNSYIESVPNNQGKPIELWTKRPDRMKVLPGKRGIEGYEWQGTAAASIRWPANPITGASNIRHIRTFNPRNDWYGMSPIEAAAYNIDQHNESDVWNMGLLKNFAAPSGALETDSHLGKDEVARLREDWRNRQQGAENAGNVVFLTHGFKWRGLSFSPRDMMITQSKAFNARFIALALGVPPYLIGLPEGSTFTNFSEARLAFWDETIVPLSNHIVGEFSNWLLPMFPGTRDLKIGLKLDEIPALEPRRTSRWNRVINAVDKGILTPNDGRRELGFAPLVGQGDDLKGPSSSTGDSDDTGGDENEENFQQLNDKLDRLMRTADEIRVKGNGSDPDSNSFLAPAGVETH